MFSDLTEFMKMFPLKEVASMCYQILSDDNACYVLSNKLLDTLISKFEKQCLIEEEHPNRQHLSKLYYN